MSTLIKNSDYHLLSFIRVVLLQQKFNDVGVYGLISRRQELFKESALMLSEYRTVAWEYLEGKSDQLPSQQKLEKMREPFETLGSEWTSYRIIEDKVLSDSGLPELIVEFGNTGQDSSWSTDVEKIARCIVEIKECFADVVNDDRGEVSIQKYLEANAMTDGLVATIKDASGEFKIVEEYR